MHMHLYIYIPIYANMCVYVRMILPNKHPSTLLSWRDARGTIPKSCSVALGGGQDTAQMCSRKMRPEKY